MQPNEQNQNSQQEQNQQFQQTTNPPVQPQVSDAGSQPLRNSQSKKPYVLAVLVSVVLIAGTVGAILLTSSSEEDKNSSSVQTEEQQSGESPSSPSAANSYSPVEVRSRDVQRIADINNLHMKLEEFFNQNAYYPGTFTVSTFPGIDAEALNDPDGNPVRIAKPVSDETAALAVPDPTKDTQYLYVPFSCSSSTECSGYVLKAYIEEEGSSYSNPYQKIGLNNP